MPVIHRYTDHSGIYLRSSIEGTFVTFQLTPAAEKFLKNQGYGDGESISWSLIKPLWEEGHVYTGGSGTNFSVDDVREDSSETDAPTDNQVDALKNFLQSGDSSDDDHGQESSNDAEKSGKMGHSDTRKKSNKSGEAWEVPTAVQRFLNNSASGVSGKKAIRRLINRTNSRKESLESIQQFVRHPIEIENFSVGADGYPRYELNSRGIRWICCDKRGAEVDFVHTISAGKSSEQSLVVEDGGLGTWIVKDAPVSKNHVRDLAKVLPPIFEFHYKLDQYPVHAEKWSFSDTELNLIASDQREGVLEKIESIKNAVRSVEEDEFVRGRVDFARMKRFFEIEIENSGIFAVGQKKRYEGPKLTDGDEVGFKVNRVKGELHARNIRPWSDVSEELSREKQSKSEGSMDASFEHGELDLLFDFTEDLLSIIEEWTDDTEQFCTRVGLNIEFADQGDALGESIRAFSSASSLDVVGLEVTGKGSLAYRLNLPEKEGYWICVHHFLDSAVDFEIEIHPEGCLAHTTQIVDGKFEYWRPISEGTPSSLEDRHQFVTSLPKYVPFVANGLSSLDGYTIA